MAVLGERGLAPVELLQLDAIGVFEDDAEGQVESADTVDLSQCASVLLQSLGLNLEAVQDAPDRVNELLLVLVLLVNLLVVRELLGGGGRHDCFCLL